MIASDKRSVTSSLPSEDMLNLSPEYAGLFFEAKSFQARLSQGLVSFQCSDLSNSDVTAQGNL